MASFRKRNGVWRAEICKKGVRDSRSFDTKAQAMAWALSREAEIESGPVAVKAQHTVKQMLEKFRDELCPSRRGGPWEIKRINSSCFASLHPLPVAEVKTPDIVAWRDLRSQAVSAGTVLRERNLLRSIFETARREWQWIALCPLDDVRWPKNPKPRDRRIADDEIRRLLLAMNYSVGERPLTKTHQVAIAFLLAIETAMRASEICSITTEAVRFKERYVRLENTKNGDSRQVPLSTRAIELLQLIKKDTGAWFDLTPGQLDALFRKCRNRAQIEDLHFHDTRHEALTRLARKLDVLDLARMVGHRDVKSLMIYYNATATEIAARLD